MLARFARSASAVASAHVRRSVSATAAACVGDPGAHGVAGADKAMEKVGLDYGSVDNYFEKARLAPGDASGKRAFTYFVLGAAKFTYASAARLAVINAVATMSASADVLALASLEVDMGAIPEGNTVTVKWRGKPVFIRHRNDTHMDEIAGPMPSGLRDPQEDADRVQDPKWLVIMGICTHLGCVPMANAGNYKGWYCPCHGSHYDGSGRIRQGPAPLNLEVPPYKIADGKIILG